MSQTSITLRAADLPKLAELLLQQGFIVPGNGGFVPATGLVIGIPGSASVPGKRPEDPPEALPGVFIDVHAQDAYPPTEWDARISGLRKKDTYEGSKNTILGGASYADAFPVAPVVERAEAVKALAKAIKQGKKLDKDDDLEDVLDEADTRGKEVAKAERDAKKAARQAERRAVA